MSPARPTKSGKHALLIGIDAYPRLTPLNGCVNDVALMRSVLEECFGFASASITLLANEQATRTGILAAFDALVQQTRPDDCVVIHYAGHGSLMTDREGDEPSGYDSTIMPFDSEGWQGDNRDITDDEIHLRLLRLAEVTSNITLIFDCCHSGTIARDAFGGSARTMPADTRPVSELPPSPVPSSNAGREGWLPLDGRYVLLSGCRDEELAYEYVPPEGGGNVRHGALTWFLTRELRTATAGTTWRDVFERAAAYVTAARPAQHPQIEGSLDRVLFGVTEVTPLQYARVLDRDGDFARIAWGAAMGATVGSRFDVFPQSARTPDAAADGSVVVIEVGATTARVRIMHELVPGAITAGMRAIEVSHAYDLRQGVRIDSPDDAAADAMRAAIEASALLRVTQRDDAIAQVRRDGEGAEWIVERTDRRRMLPPAPLDDVDRIVRALENVARYVQALSLENRVAGALHDRFGIELLRRATSGEWITAAPEDGTGDVVFEEGDMIDVRIVSHHDAAAFVNVLDFGVHAAIQLIYPARGAGEQLRPGGSFSVSGGRGIRLKFPDVPDGDDGPVHAGVEIVRLIVTSEQADFSWLRQADVRAAAADASPLVALWRAATSGGGMRDMAVEPDTSADWTTVTRAFVLRRRTSVPLAADAPAILPGMTISAPGVAGVVHVQRPSRNDVPAGETLHAAMRAHGITARQQISIADAHTVARGGTGVVDVTLPDPGIDFAQMLLVSGDDGVKCWHFAASDASRGGSTRAYSMPLTTTDDATSRGIAAVAGKKFLELVFPKLDPVFGRIGEHFAARWEAANRPYGLRSFTPDDFAQPVGAPIEGETWQQLGSGRALLFVHGTFSRAHTAFGTLTPEFVATLHERYGGRVFAFDHPTLSEDPRANVEWLLSRLPSSIPLDIDIICHSRGGLVARVLAERIDEINAQSRNVRIGNVVFAGAPNAGTLLADGARVADLLNSYTNLLTFLPDTGAADIIAGVLTVAKQVAVGAMAGLKGLQSMRPGGDFAKWLNTGTRTGVSRYYALASDYTPAVPGLREFARNRLMDSIFKAPNDLVVPTEGVFGSNGSPFFPIDERLVLNGAQSVGHTGYFASAAAREHVLRWLAGP